MPDQWPPTAPGIKKAFRGAQDASNENVAPKTEPEKQALPIVTKKELDALKKQRDKPEPHLVLNPPGATEIKEKMAKEREEKIKRMQERLQLPKDRARDDFQRSR
jgi:hypothetical protein